MKLDPRIKSLSDILTCFDEEKAEQFLGKKVYFTNHIGDFHRLKNCKYGELVAVVDDPYYPYGSKPDGDNIETYSFFIPESSLKPVEENNKLKPFTIEKFCRAFKFGEFITYRKKDTKHTYLNMFVGYDYADEESDNPSLDSIHLGACSFNLQELFDNYEYQDRKTEDWKPFGVEE